MQSTPDQLPPAAANEEKALDDFLSGLATGSPIKISIIRKYPKTWKGRNIEGVVSSHEEPFDEDDLKEWHGGGHYMLRVFRQDARGSLVYFKTRTVKIAGDPKLDGLDDQASNGATNGASHEPTTVVNNAMRLIENNSREMVDRVTNMHNQRDPHLDMMMEEMKQIRQQNADMQQKLFSNANNGHAEQLLGQVIQGESSRTESLRTQFEMERRASQEYNARQIEMAQQSAQNQIRSLEAAQQREVTSLQQSYQMQIDTLKLSYDGRLSSMERELTTAQAEVAVLRAKKEKSTVDSIQEIVALREVIGSLGGEEKEPSAIEKIAAAVGGPVMERFMGGGPMAATGAAMAAVAPNPAPPVHPDVDPSIPVNQLIKLPDGRTVVQREDGVIKEIRTRGVHSTSPEGERITISDEDLLAAEAFLGQAYYGTQPPEDVAQTILSMFPGHAGKIRQIAATEGVDVLLRRVAKLRSESPLLSADGKAWFEKVITALA